MCSTTSSTPTCRRRKSLANSREHKHHLEKLKSIYKSKEARAAKVQSVEPKSKRQTSKKSICNLFHDLVPEIDLENRILATKLKAIVNQKYSFIIP
jgi:hypothetical protein